MIQVISRKVEDLVPYKKNPRLNNEAVKYVKASISAFGFKVPIVIDQKNVVVAGHTRLLAAKELHLDTVPCIVADDLSEDQIRAFRLADNKTAEMSAWDFPLLEQEMELIPFDMTQFGFESIEELHLGEDFFKDAGDSSSGQGETLTTCPYCGKQF